jgi:hypothetical protein
MTSPEKKTKFNTKLLAAITIIVIVTVSIVTAQYGFLQNSEPQKNTQLSAISLLLVGSDGTTRTLNENEIIALESYTGSGGIRSQGNHISGVGTYTGVPVLTLVNLVGGIKTGETLTATASDNYTMTYTYDAVVNGQGFTTYDTSGSQKDAAQQLKLVLTYYYEGSVLSSDYGPLRMGILGSEGLVTQGNQWGKWVVKLQVNPSDSETTPSPTPQPTTAATATPTASPTTSPTITASPTPTSSVTLPATQLTIIGANGNNVTIDQTALTSYTVTSGLGGKFKDVKGTFDYGTYSGVSVVTLLNLVGGISSSQQLIVTCSDGYSQSYSYTQVIGTALTMYNPATNSTAATTGPVTMILAYSYNSTVISASLGNPQAYLTTAFVGPDGYATLANMYSKDIVKLQVSG